MARSDLVKRMIQSHQRGDDAGFRRVAEEIVAEERRKRHDTLADELERLLSGRTGRRPLTVSSLKPLPKTRDDADLLRLIDPRTTFHDLVLKKETQGLLEEIISEYQQRDVLASHMLRARSRLLFIGPPGCGKSRTSEAVANYLGLPLAKVQLSTVVSSFLGETSRHLHQILDFCEKGGSWVLLFDEIDTLAKERADKSEHGELRRVVATLLQLLDDFEGDAMVIAASNHPALLDEAVWRRFDEVVVFDPPTQAEIAELLRIKLRAMRVKFDRRELAREMKGFTHADVEMVCVDAARTAVLDGRDTVHKEDMERHIERMRRRLDEVNRLLS